MRSTASFGRLHAGSVSPEYPPWPATSVTAVDTTARASSACAVQHPQLGDDARAGLVAFLREGRLEIRDQRAAERQVRLGAGDDLVERAAGSRQLLGRPYPGKRCGPEHPEKPTESLFVVRVTVAHLTARRPSVP